MNDVVSWLLPLTSIQSDRIQGMARYMNTDGASANWVALGLIFIGMVAVIIGLKWVANHNARKQEEALRERLARNRKSGSKTPARGHVRRLS